ncbi:SanA protein [Alkalispirochaeta americana]|uniref:SanA protein n=1 Tax=Alkalispirochaeta americana TaxID=159291 RepID=A0A1N6QUP1_9SPIO|nr:ElyC/SanA/YdcF family protein [Alkalispirochaeta americana]SIQ20242.1 SanA protein [Alkalispirochaeta americana]
MSHRLISLLSTVWRVVRLGVLFVLLVVFFSHAVVKHAAEGKILTDPRDLPADSVILLLGTSRYTRSGAPNQFFHHRIQAVAKAYETGKVLAIVASGDNSSVGYNEPLSMYNALREAGVASSVIVLDYAGLRTLDSVWRMQQVFGQERFVIVSQPFHVERALFIAAHRGVDAIGLAAEDATGVLHVYVRLREYLARVQAVLDVYLFRTEPGKPKGSFPIEFSPFFDVESAS